MLNLKGETVISGQVWGLLSFRNTSMEDSVIYPYFPSFDLLIIYLCSLLAVWLKVLSPYML